MALHGRLPVHLFGCVLFGTVVFAGAPYTAAQSRIAQSAKTHAGAANVRSGQRADVVRFRERADAALAAPGADKGLWGVLVTDAATGEVFYARNTDNYFSPASNAKLFTTAFAFATLGPNFRVKTSVTGSGSLDANGVLHGDLVLTGRGDANLSNRKFPYGKRKEREGPPEKVLAEFADTVAVRGVKEVTGDVVADDSMFQREKFPSGWAVDDILWSYGAAVSAIDVNDNMFTLEIRPGEHDGDPAKYNLAPDVNFYKIENLIRTGVRGSEEKLAVARDPGSRLIRVTGTMPVDAQPRRLTIGIEEPAEYAASLLAQLLIARGVKVDGVPRARHAVNSPPPSEAAQAATADWSAASEDLSAPGEGPPAGPEVAPENILAERDSVSLSDDIRLTNKNSENLQAELLLLLGGHERLGLTSYEDALKFESDFFKITGIADGDVVLTDGSGLSRKDLVTPRAVVQLLRYASAQPWGELYRSSLPVAGEDGTLSERMKNSPAAGRVFAKTGTIGHVNSLAGYATTLHGTHLLFSILGNNNNLHAQDANRVIDAIVVAMVEELGPAEPAGKRK